MEAKEKFKVVYYTDALEFLQKVELKTREKIVYNVDKARFALDPKLFKKLTGSDVWEFRTLTMASSTVCWLSGIKQKM